MTRQSLAQPLLVICLAVWFTTALAEEGTHEEKLIGWRGETYSSEEVAGKQPWIQTIAWTPRVFIHRNLVSAEEARALRNLAAATMRQSSVVGTNGSSVLHNARTSYGTFLRRLSNPLVTAVSERVAKWVALPPVHQEDIQVLRYSLGQKYDTHFDGVIDDSPRLCTVLVYLSDVEEGGETAFPEGSEWISPEHAAAGGPFSACAAHHVAFKPRLGDAVLFFSLHPDGTHNPAATHTGCPVIRGVKWTATFWIHTMPFAPKAYKPQPPELAVDPGWCEDSSASCTQWAKAGECTHNPVFMVGDSVSTGKCRLACQACEPCLKGTKDVSCYERNRLKAGYLVLRNDEV